MCLKKLLNFVCYDISGYSSIHVMVVVSTYDDRIYTKVDGLRYKIGLK